MPQTPNEMIDFHRRKAEEEKKKVAEIFEAHHRQQKRLEGDELVSWVRSALNIEFAIKQHEALGLLALQKRGLTLGEWQIDPDGHILPRQQESNSSGPTPPLAMEEPTHSPDH